MDASDYQKQSTRTLIDDPGFQLPGKQMMILWCVIGLSGESGEIAELVKKGILHRHGLDIDKLKKEIGDIMWYIAGLCSTLNLDLSEILQMNIDKLLIRYPNGFNPDDSRKRVDTSPTPFE